MKYEFVNNKSIAQFNSINEFYSYLCNTPYNNSFEGHQHSSVGGSYSFTQTYSFDEAVDLMKNGWSDMAKELTTKLKVKENKSGYIKGRKTFNSVAGYQPNVPLYLMDVPTNMINSKMVPVKRKIVNITKIVSYPSRVSAGTIIEESVKVLQIVKKLEAMGYRINLNVVLACEESPRELYAKVCIKHATEKLNVSKVAFPLVHPSMLRRLFFRYIEVCPDVTRDFVDNYGIPMGQYEVKKIFPDDIIIPTILNCEADDINSLEDFEILENKIKKKS